MSNSRFRLNILTSSIILLGACVIGWLAVRLSPNGRSTAVINDVTGPDTLRVAMINAPYSCYEYRDTTVGYDYELAHVLADSLHRPIRIIMASGVADLVEMVSAGKVDIAVGPVADTRPTRSLVALCGPERISHQVLVQRRGEGQISDVTSLPGHTVTVEDDTRYAQRMRNLNNEIGGGVNISVLDNDTLSEGDLVSLVDRSELEMTVIDSDLATYNASRFPRLDFSVPLSLDQRLRWAVNPSDTLLARVVDRWTSTDSILISKTYSKYYLDSRNGAHSHPHDDIVEEAGEGTVSAVTDRIKSVPYIRHFQSISKRLGYDWRLAAAVAYVESRFKPDIVSWAGARGIMQVMPGTARGMGINPSRLTDPAVCIEAGITLLLNLDKALAKRIPDHTLRRDFVLASYNAGMGHIVDAIALARKYGLDASRWEGGVSRAALMKSKPKYYRDPVVKNGYFHARETVDFVHSVNAAYRQIISINS